MWEPLATAFSNVVIVLKIIFKNLPGFPSLSVTPIFWPKAVGLKCSESQKDRRVMNCFYQSFVSVNFVFEWELSHTCTIYGDLPKIAKRFRSLIVINKKVAKICLWPAEHSITFLNVFVLFWKVYLTYMPPSWIV